MFDRITKLCLPIAALLVATVAVVRPADAGKNRIDAVRFDDAGQSTTIRIRGTSVPTFTVYKLERPNRVVIDISGAELGPKVKAQQDNAETISVSTWAVNAVAATRPPSHRHQVRSIFMTVSPRSKEAFSIAGQDAPASTPPHATTLSRRGAPE